LKNPGIIFELKQNQSELVFNFSYYFKIIKAKTTGNGVSDFENIERFLQLQFIDNYRFESSTKNNQFSGSLVIKSI